MLYRSGGAPQYTGHLVIGLCPPPVLRCVANRTAHRNCRLRHSHSRACPLLFPFVSTSDSIGLDSMNGLASAPCARCVGSFLIDNKFSKAFFLCRRLNLWICSFFAVSCLVFLLSFPNHMCPPFLTSCTGRRTVVRRLILYLFCDTAHVVYYCSWLSFCSVFKASKCMYELFLVVQYVKSLPSIEEYMISFVFFSSFS
jgi:hypothetical protein